jgi:hypothetical protein
MSIEFWTILWKLVLIIGVGLFAGLAVVVIIGGALDIRRLLNTLRKQHEQRPATRGDLGGAQSPDFDARNFRNGTADQRE